MQFFLEFKFIVVSSIVLLFLCASDGAKILSVFGYPGPSQYIMASALLKELAKRGHEVTSISTFPQKQPLKNFRDIAVMENAKLYDSLTTEAVESQTETGYFKTFNDLSSVGCKMVQNILENPQVQNIMKNEKFDLIIMELFINDALYGLGQHFNAPMIGVSTFGTINFIDVLVNNISPISYIPHMGLTYNNHMTLQERLWNAIYSILDDLHFNYIRLPPQEKLYKKYFPHSQKTFEEVMKNFSLVLLNQHFSLSYPRPYVPNMIEVGGLHIKQKPDPLPQDLQKILDNAKEGVIYFSMGSNFKSKYIPSETLNIFLDTFRELKIKVLWKFEDDSLTNKPLNVIIKPWYPQPSHSGLRTLFFGNNSLTFERLEIFE